MRSYFIVECTSVRILFIHPRIPARFNGAPYGLLQIATVAYNAGHEVFLADYQAHESLADPTQLVHTFQPDVVCLASTSPSHHAAVSVAKKLRNKFPELILVKGGVHETYCGLHTIDNVPEINYVLRGEADYSFLHFLSTLEAGEDLERVPGLVYRSGGRVCTGGPVPMVPLNDDLPRPNRELLGETDAYDFKVFNGRRTTQVQTMRGCPFQCSFCNQRNRVRTVRSIDHVVEELHFLQSQGYEAVFFDDATFTVNRRYTIELMEKIVNVGVDLQYGCQTRSILVDDEVCRAMSRAGMAFVSFGLETLNPNALKSVLKTKSFENHISSAESAVEACKKYGIASGLNLIVGFEDEEPDNLTPTYDYLDVVEPSYVSISALALYPHEKAGLEDVYLDGVSMEPIWEHFDEGYGAIHPYLTAQKAQAHLDLARERLGEKLAVC